MVSERNSGFYIRWFHIYLYMALLVLTVVVTPVDSFQPDTNRVKPTQWENQVKKLELLQHKSVDHTFSKTKRQKQSWNRGNDNPLSESVDQMTRRNLLQSIITAPILSATVGLILNNEVANAAETVGKDPNCNDSTCLGVWDGLLADCPHPKNSGTIFPNGAGCVSSQDDTPGIFAEPWDFSEFDDLSWENQMKILVPSIQIVASKRGDTVQIINQEGRYLRVQFVDGKTREASIGEFYFTPDDTTVQFRIVSTGNNINPVSSYKNIERAELIRKQMRYLKLPVLRNRQRSFLFLESDQLDRFGPGSAALGPPAEMTTGELEGRLSDTVDPNLKIDLLQQVFPLTTTKIK